MCWLVLHVPVDNRTSFSLSFSTSDLGAPLPWGETHPKGWVEAAGLSQRPDEGDSPSESPGGRLRPGDLGQRESLRAEGGAEQEFGGGNCATGSGALGGDKG